MHQPVDGRRRGHRVLEDLLPLGERKAAGQHHAAALVALGEQGEQHGSGAKSSGLAVVLASGFQIKRRAQHSRVRAQHGL